MQRLLAAAGNDLVLVGGQALAYWVNWYDLTDWQPANSPAISNDADFLTKSAADRASVKRMAGVFNGHIQYPNRRALTALVGQAYLQISDDEIINVDIIFEVLGIKTEAVHKRAVQMVMDDGKTFLVMHPLDVLRSRVINLYKVAEKQGDKGRLQLALAIDVARAFMAREAKDMAPAKTASGRSPLQGYVSEVERLAVEDAGRKIAARFSLHVADAIDPHLIPAGPFWTKRWPTLQKLMSSEYRGNIVPPQPKAAAKKAK